MSERSGTAEGVAGELGRDRASSGERWALGLISSGHYLSHFYGLALPPLFPLLKTEFGVTYIELGLAMTAYGFLGGLVQAPVGFLVDHGSEPGIARGHGLDRHIRSAHGVRLLILDAAGARGVRRTRQQRFPSCGLRHPGGLGRRERWPRIFVAHLLRLSAEPVRRSRCWRWPPIGIGGRP